MTKHNIIPRSKSRSRSRRSKYKFECSEADWMDPCNQYYNFLLVKGRVDPGEDIPPITREAGKEYWDSLRKITKRFKKRIEAKINSDEFPRNMPETSRLPLEMLGPYYKIYEYISFLIDACGSNWTNSFVECLLVRFTQMESQTTMWFPPHEPIEIKDRETYLIEKMCSFLDYYDKKYCH